MSENQLLTGSLEETNDAYAIAKIAGLKMCEYYSKIHKINFKGLMPPNLYGPNDNYNLKVHTLSSFTEENLLCKN